MASIPHDLTDARPRGWFHIDNAVLLEYGPQIGAIGVAVYAALAAHCAGDSTQRTCFPSYNRLATLLDLSRPTVIKAVARLIDVGLVSVTLRSTMEPGGARNQSNLYTLCAVKALPTSKGDLLVKEIDQSEGGTSKGDLPVLVKEIYQTSKGDLPITIPIEQDSLEQEGGVVPAPETPPLVRAPQPSPFPVSDAPRHTPPGNGRSPATPDPAFLELTPARQRQAALADRAHAARNAAPPEPCPAWGDLSPAVKAELVALIAPYSDDPEAICRRQVAWFRRGKGTERRLRAEWVVAFRGVIQEEIDLRLPTGPLRAAPSKGTSTIPIVERWN